MLIDHLPLLTLTRVSSRGKWNSGRNISVGANSVAEESQTRKRVKVALRMSKAYDFRLPVVNIGLGLTYASAARKPGLALGSAGIFEGSGLIGGVDRALFKFDGETETCSLVWL